MDVGTLCVHGRVLKTTESLEYINEAVVEFWIEKFQADDVVWIYYATEEGVMFNYPATAHQNPDYDPRYRSTYTPFLGC